MKKHIFIFLLLFLINYPCLANEDIDEHTNISASFENDIFIGTDRHYTNGVKLSYVSAENDAPKWLLDFSDKVPIFQRKGKTRYSFALGQNMFTPSDIKIAVPEESERPYAGWLYMSSGLISDAGDRLDNIELTIGIVGPLSYAEETQKWVHKNISGSPEPKGWDTQLKNELGLVASYERMWRLIEPRNRSYLDFDFMPHLGGSIGNVFTHINTGGTFRFGSNLNSDYGAPRIRPSLPGSSFFKPIEGFLWYGFAGFSGRYVLRNIFLDGNSFRHSHSVKKIPMVGDFQFGFVLGYDNIRLSLTHILRTEEFKKQKAPDNFSSMNINFAF